MKPSCIRVLARLGRGWATNYELVSEYGTEALRRLRELKSMGYPIENERIRVNGRCTNTYRYRLQPVADPQSCPGCGHLRCECRVSMKGG